MVGSYGDGGSTSDLVTASSGASAPQTTFYLDYTDQIWYYTTSNVMVRMNFNPALVGITENEMVFSVYPNPASYEITVSSSLTEGTITISDVAGKLVKTTSLSGLSTSLNTAGLNNGVYYVNVSNGTTTATEKVVIKK